MYTDFKGKKFVIVGGGNSLNVDILKEIPADNIICINSSMVHLEKFFALFWMDNSWYVKPRNRKIMGMKDIKHKIFINNNKPIYTDNVFTWVSRTNILCDYSKDDYNDMSVIGNNTGACCLHFLDKVGADSAYLLGFDGKTVNGKSHSHEEYKIPTQQCSLHNVIAPCFDALQKNIKQLNVFNCFIDSNIKSFPFISVEKMLSQFKSA